MYHCWIGTVQVKTTSPKYMGIATIKIRRSKKTILRNKVDVRSEEHTSELQSLTNLVCRLLLEKKQEKPQVRGDATRADPFQHHRPHRASYNPACRAAHGPRPEHSRREGPGRLSPPCAPVLRRF